MIGYIQNKAHRYFGLQVIGNANKVLPNPLAVSYTAQLSGGNAIEIQNFHDKVCSDMAAKEIQIFITNASLKKLRIHQRE